MLSMNEFEVKVAESLTSRGLIPFRPVKDDGVDFVALHRGSEQIVRLQVKGSTLFGGHAQCERCGDGPSSEGGGWFKIGRSKACRQASLTDFYVFVWPSYGEAGRKKLDRYLIIPTSELIRRMHLPDQAYPKLPLLRDAFAPWFVARDDQTVLDLSKIGKAVDRRSLIGTERDYSAYYREQGWRLVFDFLGLPMKMAA